MVLPSCRCIHRSKEAKGLACGHAARKGLRQDSHPGMGTREPGYMFCDLFWVTQPIGGIPRTGTLSWCYCPDCRVPPPAWLVLSAGPNGPGCMLGSPGCPHEKYRFRGSHPTK